MPNLALLILITVFLTQAVSWIGKSVLQSLAFSTYSRIFLSSKSKQQRTLRKQVLTDKAELAKTSSQDEFAKWARLRRKVDKSLADLEKINTSLTSSQSSFSTKFSSALWLMTTGSQMFLVWWYKSQPVFWLPKGWFPSLLVWVLSFPSAPLGSISPFFWSTACQYAFSTIKDIVLQLLPVPAGPVPVPVPASAPKEVRPQATIEHEKLD